MMRWRFQAYGQGKMPETARMPQDRAEGLYGGAAKHFYVKRECPAESHEDKQNASGKAQVA